MKTQVYEAYDVKHKILGNQHIVSVIDSTIDSLHVAVDVKIHRIKLRIVLLVATTVHHHITTQRFPFL